MRSQKTVVAVCLSLGLAASFSALAQDVGRVSPAALPIPLPSSTALPPDVLRSQNPWNLPMTGVWKFAFTHGEIKDGKFVTSQARRFGVTASSNEDKNPPENAFDGNDDTRWCAINSSFPQWLQTDLLTDQQVSGVSLKWENGGARFRCRIEGRAKGGKWVTLADKSEEPGIGDGQVEITPAMVRFVRIKVLGNSGAGNWASIREFQIHLNQNGQDVVWNPQSQKDAAQVPSSPDWFASTDLDDSEWDDLSVPSNWEMYGYSSPTYNYVDDTVGMYRRLVTIPASWAGRKIFWHFDGSLDGTEVFINGQKAGYHESGYTAWNIDLTDLVKPGQPNLFAVRVSKKTPSSDCETGDFQCMGGSIETIP